MPLPPAFSTQTLNALDGAHYETAKRQIEAHNQLISALGPGTSISPANFSLNGFGAGANVSATVGSFKRGSFTLKVGASGVGANPSLTLTIPAKEFGGMQPHIVLSQSGGTGTTRFSYAAIASSVTVTFSGTPSANDTYTFNFQMSD